MKTITLQEAHTILEQASAVIINHNAVVYPALDDLQDDLDNRFLYLSWDDEGRGFDLTFAEEGNSEVKVDGSDLFLEDIHGNTARLTILVPQKLD